MNQESLSARRLALESSIWQVSRIETTRLPVDAWWIAGRMPIYFPENYHAWVADVWTKMAAGRGVPLEDAGTEMNLNDSNEKIALALRSAKGRPFGTSDIVYKALREGRITEFQENLPRGSHKIYLKDNFIPILSEKWVLSRRKTLQLEGILQQQKFSGPF